MAIKVACSLRLCSDSSLGTCKYSFLRSASIVICYEADFYAGTLNHDLLNVHRSIDLKYYLARRQNDQIKTEMNCVCIQDIEKESKEKGKQNLIEIQPSEY